MKNSIISNVNTNMSGNTPPRGTDHCFDLHAEFCFSDNNFTIHNAIGNNQ